MKTSTSRRVRAAAASAALLLLTVWIVEPGSPVIAAAAAPGSQRPSAGPVVNVSTEAELQSAVARLTSGMTIVIAPGTYRLTGTLYVRGILSDVTIKGATENAGDVVLVGRGMANTNHGGVPHGIVLDGRLQRMTIANLSIREVAQHAILVNAGASAPRIHNVHLLNAGRQFVKVTADGRGRGVDDGVVEYSVMEYSATALDSQTGGIEVAGGGGWIVRHNLFRNIEASGGGLAGPAVLMWQGSRDSVVDGNAFINCQREVALGLEERARHDHAGGIIRNNVIYRDSIVQGQTAILVADSPKTQVLHNTILVNNTYSTLIEYRFRGSAGIIVRNNLLDGQIEARDRAAGTAKDNYTQAHAGLFVNAAAGDLHLDAGAVAVLDQVPVLREAATDFDGQARQEGRLADYGADEYIGAPVPPATPEPPPARAVTETTTAAATTTSKTTTSTASNIEPAAAADGALPAPWDSLDIGSTPAGSAGFWYDIFVVRGGGADIGGNADQFRFVYQALDGDGEIVARVDTLDKLHPWAKAGVMIRNELTPGAKYAAALVTAGKGLVFQRRIANDATTTQSSGGSGRAPHWVKLVRSGDTFTAYGSRDGVKWTVMGSEVVYLNRTAYVGLAVTSHVNRALATAGFREVTVVSNGGSSNQPPAVRIAAPAQGSVYSSPATIEISAMASDPDGSVKKVDFYAGATAIGSASSSPFSVKWHDAPSGKHVLKAVAHDDKGAAATSTGVEVEVTTPSNQPPSVSLTAPANNASYTAPATIELKALAADTDGTIARVDFYSGSTQIGSDTTSPYSAMWGNVPAGTYTVKAVARDNSGGTASSAAVTVSVGGTASKPPMVGLTQPANGATFTAPATITFSASASDPDGSVTSVEFHASGVLLGSDTSSPYSVTISGMPAGTYAVTALARDDSGRTATSSPVSITIQPAGGTNLPRMVIFRASPDHDTSVISYSVEVFRAGANSSSTAPYRAQNVGKPVPVNGEIAVSVDAMIQALPAGTYFITASATGSGGTSRSEASETFVR